MDHALHKRQIAITGGIASGKSTVCSIIAEKGYSVESADEIAKAIFDAPDIQNGLARLLDCAVPVSKEFLKERMSASSEVRKAVNALMHRRILTQIRNSDATFIEVPLLIETCIMDSFSQIWVVFCDAETQRKRLESRVKDPAAVERWLQTQLPSRAKIAFADTIIRTNTDIATVREDIAKLLLAVCAE